MLNLYKVGKEIVEITIPSKEEADSMKAYKKIVKATIVTLENRVDSEAKLERESVAFVTTECTNSRRDFLYLQHLSCLCQRIKDWYFSIEL